MTANVTQHYALKNDKSVLILDKDGRLPADKDSAAGLYKNDTRIVRLFDFKINGLHPTLQKVRQTEPNSIELEYGISGLNDKVIFQRNIIIKNDNVFECWKLENQSDKAIPLEIDVDFATGYNDIFDVRDKNIRNLPHNKKPVRGQVQSQQIEKNSYFENWKFNKSQRQINTVFKNGLDLNSFVNNKTFLLKPNAQKNIYFRYGDPAYEKDTSLSQIYGLLSQKNTIDFAPVISSDDTQLNKALQTAQNDIAALLTNYDTGPYPHAGLPWFSCPFGRDALITSLLLMDYSPELSKSVLLFQAKHQAQKTNSFQQAEKGKIFHEMRFGEASYLKENPFKLYYGGVDTTPLFVLTAGKYFKKNEDHDFLKTIWPNIQSALEWVCNNMDQNGGYLRYSYDPNGLTQQGWKDSGDAIFNPEDPDQIAQDPIALCEVQAYAHAALCTGAEFAKICGDETLMKDYQSRAEKLKDAFNNDFWMDKENCYALALDGKNRQINVVTTNAGHCLLTDIIPLDRQQKLVKRLMQDDIFSGYGLRTLAKGPGYDPHSYHRGSVWPHDTALVGLGMAQKGFEQESFKLTMALYNIVKHTENMPELISGKKRQGDHPPIPYKSSCLIQAWSAAAFISLALQNFEKKNRFRQ